ncbi:MAG: glucose-1-phosphate adenylyltransferase [Pseudomonadota bacterium]
MSSKVAGNPEARISRETLTLILAGGSGSRLHDLTRWHAKPAVPFGGTYKTIDFPLSNCINSDLRRIFILTQYKSHSLNKHILQGWHLLHPELNEFIELLPAQQRTGDCWYLGTADAVRQNLDILREQQPQRVLILAGDHVYKMDYRHMLRRHLDSGADLTIGCLPVPLAEARQFGVIAVDGDGWVRRFDEKPAAPQPWPENPDQALASMGIYVFELRFLEEVLERNVDGRRPGHDFGCDILPALLDRARVAAYEFRDPQTGRPGYWRDVGTVDAYYEAHMDLLAVTPQLDLYDRDWPVWTYQEQAPPCKFVFDNDQRRGQALDSMIASGCIISGGTVRHSLLGTQVRVNSFALVEDSVILPNVDIGRGCRLRRVVVDSNCKIPPGTVIGFDAATDARRFHVSPRGVTLVSADMLAQAVPHSHVA